MEVASFAPTDAVGGLGARWRLIALTTIVAALIGFGASFLVSTIYEAEVDLQVGAVNKEFIEEPRVLADMLQSEGFRRTVEADLNMTLPIRAIRTEVVGPPQPVPPGANAYVRVVAAAGTASQAHALARHVATFVEGRHSAMFERATKDWADYQAQLAEGMARLDVDVAAIQKKLAEVGPQNPVAGLLLQSSLVAARNQQIDLRRQLRDSQLAQTLMTRPTRVLGPSIEPRAPAWPNRWLFLALAAVAGLVLSAGLVLLRGTGTAVG